MLHHHHHISTVPCAQSSLNSRLQHCTYLTSVCTTLKAKWLQGPKYTYDAVQSEYEHTSPAPTLQSPAKAPGSIEPALAAMKITVFGHESPGQQGSLQSSSLQQLLGGKAHCRDNMNFADNSHLTAVGSISEWGFPGIVPNISQLHVLRFPNLIIMVFSSPKTNLGFRPHKEVSVYFSKELIKDILFKANRLKPALSLLPPQLKPFHLVQTP